VPESRPSVRTHSRRRNPSRSANHASAASIRSIAVERLM